jgi:hypothetical protein
MRAFTYSTVQVNPTPFPSESPSVRPGGAGNWRSASDPDGSFRGLRYVALVSSFRADPTPLLRLLVLAFGKTSGGVCPKAGRPKKVRGIGVEGCRSQNLSYDGNRRCRDGAYHPRPSPGPDRPVREPHSEAGEGTGRAASRVRSLPGRLSHSREVERFIVAGK